MELKRRTRGGAPSLYPRILFHGLRTAQLIASIVVSGVMCYFMYYLRAENYSVPWTFILLLTISITTMVSLLVTILLYNLTYLSPRFNLILNASISVFWALGLALLSWSISTSHVMNKACSAKNWGGEAQAGVCRDYKALWSMTLVGAISSFLALVLDIHTQRKSTKRGRYAMPADDIESQRLNDLKTMRVKSEGYEVPKEQNGDSNNEWQEQDIGYHSRYGAEEAHGPLNVPPQERDMGYHNQFFRP